VKTLKVKREEVEIGLTVGTERLCAVMLTALPIRQRFILAGLYFCFAFWSDRCRFIGQSV